MRMLITAVTVAVLLASTAAAPVLAGGGHGRHGIWYGSTYNSGYYSKHRSSYGYRYRRHGRGGYYYYDDGDAAVVLGVLAGAVVLGALLSRPAPARPATLRGATGAPLGGCLQTTGTGTWYGRPARFSGTMCYDPAGRAYVIPGSARFVAYLR